MHRVKFLLLAASLLLVGACNTVHGIGQDIKSAGSSISKASDENKK